jgi:hypothetical protein
MECLNWTLANKKVNEFKPVYAVLNNNKIVRVRKVYPKRKRIKDSCNNFYENIKAFRL